MTEITANLEGIALRLKAGLEWDVVIGSLERVTPFELQALGGDFMYCVHCGREIADSSNFCSTCGGRQRQRTSQKQLTLSATDKKLAGVCGGIAEYLDVDPTIVRLVWVALSVVPGGFVGGALAYVLAWIIIPKAPAYAPAAAGAAVAQAAPKVG